MVSRGRHPKNAIANALAELPAGFTLTEIHKGHRWGKVTCDECGANVAVFSSPKVPEHNAQTIRRFVNRHQKEHE